MLCLCRIHLPPLKDKITSGDILIKKYILVLSVVFCLMLNLTVSAKKVEMIDTLEPYGSFYILGEDNKEIAEILGISEADLGSIDDAFLAINKENTKQIRLTVSVTDFSNGIGNISNISNDKISALAPELSGVESAKGEIIEKNGQKFLKIQLRSVDSGGDYILTQYITVAAKQNFILSFYTDFNEDTEYIEKTFETFNSPHFNTLSDKDNDNRIQYVILAFAGVFLVICIAVAISIIIDIKKGKTEEEELIEE